MLIRIIRLLKRVAVLLLGIAIVYTAVWEIFPFFDNQVPWALALFATYVITAYGLVPLIIRFLRIFFRPYHIPNYCVTPDGFASDPINIGLIGTQKDVVQAMQKAGWHLADKRSLHNLWRMGMSILLHRKYNTAPFSSLYLFGRRQDLGFQKPLDNNPSHRHHVRFWSCQLESPEEFKEHIAFWQRFHRPSKINDGRQLWVGAASKDTGIAPIRHNAQLTHMIDPDTNRERDLIVDDLRKAHVVAKTITERVGAPFELRNRVLRGVLHADGRVRICILK